MTVSTKAYWTMIQGEIGCSKCSNLKPERLNCGVPCEYWTEWEGSIECPHKEATHD